MMTPFFIASLALSLAGLQRSDALVVTESARAQTARSRLAEALKSPSKKLTIHPELVLPEPSDPTALLLRASEVTKLSETIRTRAKANAVFVEGTVDALIPMAKEQEGARGNFPSPVPIIYSITDDDSLTSSLEQLQDVEGVEGVLIKCFSGKVIGSADEFIEEAKIDSSLTERCSAIWEAGLQPIPEIVLAAGSEWTEDDVEKLVDTVKESCGGLDPVSIVLTNGETGEEVEEGEEGEEENEEPSTPNIEIPSSVSKRLSFIGSVRTSAGEGRMNAATSSLSSCKFSGAFLRADCVPGESCMRIRSIFLFVEAEPAPTTFVVGYRMNPDLAVVGGFWSAAISDLKSLKSKSFSFRSKVKISKDVPMEWYNYQKDVMESGALGLGGGGGGDDGLNPDAGDYKGF